MSEKMKKFLEVLSEDKELKRKATDMSKEELVALAREKGIELMDEDFEVPEGELSEREMSDVAGGGECYCFVGGGGTEDSNGNICVCVLLGIGENDDFNPDTHRCFCPQYGYGHDE